MVRIEQLDCSPVRAQAAVEEILREYLTWCVERLTAGCGVVFDDPAAVVQAHHEDFCHELPHLLGRRGRLLIACLDGQIIGTGALKPVDALTGEIKRMYVRPHARGHGAGRATLRQLLADARDIGYQNIRLETATFMTDAHALYRSLGFTNISAFDGAEASLSGLERHMLFMQLELPRHPTTQSTTRAT